MPTPSESDRAKRVLEKALISCEIEASDFLERLRFDEHYDDEVRPRLKSSLFSVASNLGWGKRTWPEVPEDKIVEFVVDSLGGDILRSKYIRGILGKHICRETSEIGLKGIKGFLGDCEDEDIPIRLEECAFRFSTNLAMEICNLSGLPYCFAIKGTGDERRPHGTIQPYSVPPRLAEFQVRVKDQLLVCLREDGGRGLVVMPTGSGKTRTTVESILEWLRELSYWPPSVLWVADRDELCEQAGEAFVKLSPLTLEKEIEYWRFWRGNFAEIREVDRGVVVPGLTITSVQQFRKRMENMDPSVKTLMDTADVIVVDEAHRNLDWIESLSEDLIRRGNKTSLVGITATPSRSMIEETGRLAAAFNHNVLVPIEGGELDPEKMTSELTNMGILSNRIEVDPSDLFGESPEGKRKIAIIEKLMETGSKSVIVFTDSVEEARSLASICRLSEEIEANADHIEANTPLSTRRSTVEAFRNGDVQILFNYGILTTGFDSPNIDAVVIFRKAIDRKGSLFTQMVGRGLRGPKFGGTKSCRLVHYRGD